MSVPITKTEEQKLKEGAAKIALAPEGQKRSKCWELFLEILVGEVSRVE